MSRKKNSVARQVQGAYRQRDLARVLTMPEQDFGAAFTMETVKTGAGELPRGSWRGRPAADYYHFRDNGSSVLAVAHLDTVVRPDRRAPRFSRTRGGPLVVSGALDDRLGAYVILDLLPKLGITCDWLLTVGEEDGQSTAESFKAGKDYDHVIEFDRGGTDVVMYQYEDDESCQRVEACGAEVGRGSFSDIAYLDHLGVKAFNWGAGYRGDYHSERGYAHLSDTFAMTAKYLLFHEQNAGVTMPHDPEDAYSAGQLDDEAYGLVCAVCDQVGVYPDDDYCEHCFSCVFCCLPEDEGCQCYKRHALSGKTLVQ
ncbi:MAG TPA: hypothetical protein VGG75_13615 [Trebonia sp.]|jgi:hypothetical protein